MPTLSEFIAVTDWKIFLLLLMTTLSLGYVISWHAQVASRKRDARKSPWLFFWLALSVHLIYFLAKTI